LEDLKAFVLAAGLSTRIASAVGGHPKPLLRLAGETVLGHNLRWLASHGIRDVWVNLHFRPEDIQAAIGDGTRFGVTVRYVYEPRILGTAGAVRNLSSEWTNTFLVVYGDNLVRMDLSSFVRFHLEKKAAISVAVFDREKHVHTGIAGGRVERASDGRITSFHEGGGEMSLNLVNAGVYLLEPRVVRQIPAGQFYDFARDLFPRLLAAGEAMFGYIMTGFCLGMDTPESHERAISLVESGTVLLS
jgi:NDP-sugar pyrophosphorylase family protein